MIRDRTIVKSMAEMRELFAAVDRLTGKLKSAPVLRAIQ